MAPATDGRAPCEKLNSNAIFRNLRRQKPLEMVNEDMKIKTVSDYPLLVGEILRRSELRQNRRARRAAFWKRLGTLYVVRH